VSRGAQDVGGIKDGHAVLETVLWAAAAGRVSAAAVVRGRLGPVQRRAIASDEHLIPRNPLRRLLLTGRAATALIRRILRHPARYRPN
jgi:hypothetical protein